MLEKLPKKEKLKSTKAINELFTVGENAYSYPIKVLYLENKNLEEKEINKVGFTVSKKKFKLAVKRNLIKRRMREAYRKNKPVYFKNYNFFIMYTSNQIESYQLIDSKLKECFSKIELK